MKRISVYIATTGGPVRIERITPERAPQSMACLRRTSTILPISADYDDFVRPGSGVIDREFEPLKEGSFRLDVSAPISAGKSWQLGVFVAHAIAASKDHALAGDDAEFDEAVVLTGQVDYDLTVESVDHIPDKLAGLVTVSETLDGRPARLIVPAGKNHEAAARIALPDGVTLVAAASAWDACRAVGLKTPSAAPSRRWRLAALAGVAAAAALIAVTGGADVSNWARHIAAAFSGGEKTPPPTTVTTDKLPVKAATKIATVPPTSSMTLRLLARRPPTGRTCADVHFGGVPAMLEPVTRNAQGGFVDSRLSALCGLAFEVAAGGAARYAALLLYVRSGKRVRSEPPPPALRGAARLSGVASWSIILPRRSPEPFAYRLVLIESERPLGAEAEALRDKPLSETAARALARKGVGVQTIDHRVMN